MNDFGISWRDGKAFNALIHALRPELVDMEKVERSTPKVNLENAFSAAEQHLGIPRLLDAEGFLNVHLFFNKIFCLHYSKSPGDFSISMYLTKIAGLTISSSSSHGIMSIASPTDSRHCLLT